MNKLSQYPLPESIGDPDLLVGREAEYLLHNEFWSKKRFRMSRYFDNVALRTFHIKPMHERFCNWAGCFVRKLYKKS